MRFHKVTYKKGDRFYQDYRLRHCSKDFSGKVRMRTPIHEGMIHGEQVFYHFSGMVSIRIPYVMDKVHGIARMWDDHGKLQAEVHFQDGERHGTACWFLPNGICLIEQRWSHGSLNSEEAHFPNGRLKRKWSKQKNGGSTEATYSPQGKMTQETVWTRDLEVVTGFDRQGHAFKVSESRKPHGFVESERSHITYYPNGSPKIIHIINKHSTLYKYFDRSGKEQLWKRDLFLDQKELRDAWEPWKKYRESDEFMEYEDEWFIPDVDGSSDKGMLLFPLTVTLPKSPKEWSQLSRLWNHLKYGDVLQRQLKGELERKSRAIVAVATYKNYHRTLNPLNKLCPAITHFIDGGRFSESGHTFEVAFHPNSDLVYLSQSSSPTHQLICQDTSDKSFDDWAEACKAIGLTRNQAICSAMKLALGDCVIAEGSAESMKKLAKRLGEYGFKTKVASLGDAPVSDKGNLDYHTCL